MKQEDFKRFAVSWKSAHEVYAKSVEPAALALVFKVLQEYELADVEAALGRHLKLCEFAPKPADIVRLIEGRADHRAALAFTEFREAIRNNRMPQDRAICEVINRLGGLGTLGDRQSRDLDFLEERFCRLYTIHTDPVTAIGIAAYALPDKRVAA